MKFGIFKKIKTTLFFNLLFLLFFKLVSSYESIELLPYSISFFHSGILNFTTDKEVYKVGENIKLNVYLKNREGNALLDTYLVIDIVKGCKEFYNPEEKNCPIVLERIINVGSFRPLEEKRLEINIPIPEYFGSDIYRIDMYWITSLAPITGIPASYFNPISTSIKIEGNNSYYPIAIIMSTDTRTAGGLSQRGPGIYNKSSLISIELHIATFKNFEGKIVYKTCEFDDTYCESGIKKYENIEEYSISCSESYCNYTHYIKPGNKNTAYSVRMELYDNYGRLNSIYRGRYVVLGESAKIMKVGVKDLEIYPNESYWIRVSLTGPLEPNREITTIKNVNLRTKIFSYENLIFENITKINELKINNLEAVEIKFSSSSKLDNFKICLELEKDGITLDNYCSSYVYSTPVTGSRESKNIYLIVVVLIITFVAIIYLIKRIKQIKHKK